MADKDETRSVVLSFDVPSVGALTDRFRENISTGGLFLPTEQLPELGETVTFGLTTGNGDVVLSGKGFVVACRQTEPIGFALRFEKLENETQSVIEQAVEKHGQGRWAPVPLARVYQKKSGSARKLSTEEADLPLPAEREDDDYIELEADMIPQGSEPLPAGPRAVSSRPKPRVEALQETDELDWSLDHTWARAVDTPSTEGAQKVARVELQRAPLQIDRRELLPAETEDVFDREDA